MPLKIKIIMPNISLIETADVYKEQLKWVKLRKISVFFDNLNYFKAMGINM